MARAHLFLVGLMSTVVVPLFLLVPPVSGFVQRIALVREVRPDGRTSGSVVGIVQVAPSAEGTAGVEDFPVVGVPEFLVGVPLRQDFELGQPREGRSGVGARPLLLQVGGLPLIMADYVAHVTSS